jgi:CubicO group peptidase (beta-lactamase class C family)
MKKSLILTALMILTVSLCAETLVAQNPPSTLLKTPIQVNLPIQAELPSDGVHTYTIELDTDFLVFGSVLQHSVDVVVKIYNPAGEEIAKFDGPSRGLEPFRFVTKSDGVYHIEITPYQKATGSYTIQVDVAERLADNPAGKTDQLMIPYSGEDKPGAAVLVMKDGQVLYQKGYGMANLAYDVPFEVDTPTNIGSTSKQFTAFAVLLLQEQGLLNIDDDVRTYLPELPDFGKSVTIRHLLSHTTGFREFLNSFAMTGAHPSTDFTDKQILRLVQRQPELQNDPGAEFNYNNTGYNLAKQIVEKLTNEPFEKWTRDHIFLPLGMTNTRFRSSPEEMIPGRSMGYSMAENGDFMEKTDLGGAMGAGGIYSTIEDLSKWIRNFKERKLGSDLTFDLMMSSNLLTTGSPSGYGLGLFITTHRGQRYVHHGGADVAHRSMLMYFTDLDAAVITQSNYAMFSGSSAIQIADFFFDAYFEQTPDAIPTDTTDATDHSESFRYEITRFDALTGRYELAVAPGFILTFSREGDRLLTQATGQPQIGIQATTDSTFTLIGVPAALTFHMNSDGSADSLTLHQNGNHIARKMSWKPDASELSTYTGSFYSTELETMYHVELVDNALQMVHYLLAEPLKLTPSKLDTFGASFPLATVEFVRNESGTITGFKASNGRTRNVMFNKR